MVKLCLGHVVSVMLLSLDVISVARSEDKNLSGKLPILVQEFCISFKCVKKEKLCILIYVKQKIA